MINPQHCVFFLDNLLSLGHQATSVVSSSNCHSHRRHMAEKTSQSLSATGGDSTHAAAASMGSPAPAELLSVPGEAPNCIISGSIHKEGRGMFGSIK